MAGAARRPPADAPPAEWSCALCTLLNSWRDRRCAACDQEREPLPSSLATVRDDAFGAFDSAAPLASSDGHTAATASALALVRGVLFRSAAVGTTGDWRSEPRLTINRRKRPLHHQVTATTPSAFNATQLQHDRPGAEEQPSFSLFHGDASAHGWTAAADESLTYQRPVDQHSRPAQAVVDASQSRHTACSALSDDEDEASQPNFQLLGPGVSLFPALDNSSPVATTTVDDPLLSRSHVTSTIPYQDPQQPSQESVQPSFELIDVSSEPTQPLPVVPKSVLQQGFVAARRVSTASNEPTVEEKLARAGLDLNESDSDYSSQRRRPGQRNKLRRNIVESPPIAANNNSNNMNDDDDEEEKAPAPATWECSICTNFNSVSLERCELCDTKRGTLPSTV